MMLRLITVLKSSIYRGCRGVTQHQAARLTLCGNLYTCKKHFSKNCHCIYTVYCMSFVNELAKAGYSLRMTHSFVPLLSNYHNTHLRSYASSWKKLCLIKGKLICFTSGWKNWKLTHVNSIIYNSISVQIILINCLSMHFVKTVFIILTCAWNKNLFWLTLQTVLM